jgi:FixJ family two-component response regulator
MPRMDGLSLIESVRELHPKVPVLLMTGSRLENRPRSYAVLNKPIGREALLQAVRSAIAAKKFARKNCSASWANKRKSLMLENRQRTVRSLGVARVLHDRERG